MVVVRNIFRVKFGQTKEATALWRQAVSILRDAGLVDEARLLTDVAGESFYTLVLETTHDSLAAWERAMQGLKDHREWQQVYAKIVAVTDSGRREILATIE